MGRFRRAWQATGALALVSAVVAGGVYLVAQTVLGALPHQPWATLGALALTTVSIASVGAGLVALLGARSFTLTAVLMIFIGNPFSAATSAPELLPGAARVIGQLLPPGAGANLVRSTAYFDGHGAALHLAVLATWTVLGLGAVAVGHHRGVARRLGEATCAPAVAQDPAPRHLVQVGAHEAV